MTRVKRGAVARRSRAKFLSLTRGAIGSNSRLFRMAKQHAIKSLRHSYRGSRERKRRYRSLWLVRLNAIVRFHNCNYSSFIQHLRRKKCLLNLKMLAQLSVCDPGAFETLLDLHSFLQL